MQTSHRIVQITDTHLFDSADGELRGVNTASSLTRVVEDIRAKVSDAELVIASGDISQDDGARSYHRFSELVAPLDVPVYSLPGNHDKRDVMREALAGTAVHYLESATVGNWSILCVDSCIDDDAAGQIDEPEMQRLEAGIHAAGDRHVLIALHHPPIPMDSEWLDTVGLNNGAEWLGRISGYENVRLILFGHVHQESDRTVGKQRIVGTPSTCAQFLPHSEKFALDERPPAWRLVDLHEDGRIETELHWLDRDE